MILIYSAFTQAFEHDIAQYYTAQHTLILQCKLVLIRTELKLCQAYSALQYLACWFGMVLCATTFYNSLQKY